MIELNKDRLNKLTHEGQMTQISIGNLSHNWFW